MKTIKKVLISVILFAPSVCLALSFDLPKKGDGMVGEAQTAMVKAEEDFSDVAENFDVGYYEVFEANPGVNPDEPVVGTVLIIPTQYIIPKELQRNDIIINLAEMRLYYLPKTGNKVFIFPVGIGKEDWDTPLGEMSVVKKVKDPQWVVPESIYKFRETIGEKIPRIIPPGPDNPLGSYKLGLSKGGFLIHGTNLPAGVGRRSSAGCIRLYESDIKQLYNMVEIGTKVLVINQPYKAAWKGGTLYLEAHMPLLEQRIEMGNDVKSALDIVETAAKGHKITIDWPLVTKIARDHLTVPRPIN
jgi:L,D-transpeptidase ErfK/SrfK